MNPLTDTCFDVIVCIQEAVDVLKLCFWKFQAVCVVCRLCFVEVIDAFELFGEEIGAVLKLIRCLWVSL